MTLSFEALNRLAQRGADAYGARKHELTPNAATLVSPWGWSDLDEIDRQAWRAAVAAIHGQLADRDRLATDLGSQLSQPAQPARPAPHDGARQQQPVDETPAGHPTGERPGSQSPRR